eukprot:6189955-Pleurochrysis_carterae.AAC.7
MCHDTCISARFVAHFSWRSVSESVLSAASPHLDCAVCVAVHQGQRSLASPELLELLTELAADEHLADQVECIARQQCALET